MDAGGPTPRSVSHWCPEYVYFGANLEIKPFVIPDLIRDPLGRNYEI
jgi:hypothetical protein